MMFGNKLPWKFKTKEKRVRVRKRKVRPSNMSRAYGKLAHQAKTNFHVIDDPVQRDRIRRLFQKLDGRLHDRKANNTEELMTDHLCWYEYVKPYDHLIVEKRS